MTDSLKISTLSQRISSTLQDSVKLLVDQLLTENGKKSLQKHDKFYDEVNLFLDTITSSIANISQMLKKNVVNDNLTKDEKSQLEKVDKKIVQRFYTTDFSESQISLGIKFKDLQAKINSLFVHKNHTTQNPANQSSTKLTLEDLENRVGRVENQTREDIFEKFSFKNVDNLIKNMHIFDEKIRLEKQKKSNRQNTNMLSCISNTQGSLDMLFASALTTEVKKNEIPKELQKYVDKLSDRMPPEDYQPMDDGAGGQMY